MWEWKDSISFVSGIYCGVKGHWRNSVWFVHATGYNRMGFMKTEISAFFEGSLKMYYFSKDINKTPLKPLTYSVTVINLLHVLMLPSPRFQALSCLLKLYTSKGRLSITFFFVKWLVQWDQVSTLKVTVMSGFSPCSKWNSLEHIHSC